MNIFSKTNWFQLLEIAISQNASDIHLTAEQRPFLRKNGQLISLELPMPDNEQVEEVISSLITNQQRQLFNQNKELDFAWNFNMRRWRFNLYKQRNKLALAGRLIPNIIPSLNELGCPSIFDELLTKKHGLILITGRTGAGKTTTIASFLNTLANRSAHHIITLEDPIEYIISTEKSFISQREYGTDFFSFPVALKSALRQCPDCLMIGELRDMETIRTALDASSTGHLVLATLHTNSAVETMLRLESFFPAECQHIRAQLSSVLLASITQQLLPCPNGQRVCAFEVMTSTPAISNLIRTGKYQQINSAILSGKSNGMVMMDDSINELRRKKLLFPEINNQNLSEKKI